MLGMYNSQYHAEHDQVLLWKIVVWDHSDHQLWTPYMWSMPKDRCSPVSSVRDKIFSKVTNWSALVPDISSEQRVQLWKIVIWEHSDHQFWTPYMWSMPKVRCSPVFSVRDKNFQKVTNWSALVPEISSEQRDLWPFRLLDVIWMQWN